MGNKVVLLLPIGVMLGLFIFGYASLSGTEEVTNEELQETIILQTEQLDDSHVNIKWQWGDFPKDGLAGMDYIELLIIDASGNEKASAVSGGMLQLTQGDDTLYHSDEVKKTSNGAVMSLPNDMSDEAILGPSGEATFRLAEPLEEEDTVAINYYHTWVEHRLPLSQEVTLNEVLEKQISQYYWVSQVSN
ncbi:hypothetical protein [Salipaludibacillus agaradhaerens]|uniref:hypothetical protein n=1 Tax=Salipaludibacillus agaradhaerens TaxID=76935 RepID=UPI000995FF46|nr:hypothetical protein [Salipaludibacillus agaradhaerens]